MRIRTAAPVLAGALALGGLAAAPAASAATNTAPVISRASASSLVFGPATTRTFSVTVKATDNSGIKNVKVVPWPTFIAGFPRPTAAEVASAGAPTTCKASSATTSVCMYTEKLNSHTDLGLNGLAGSWKVAVLVTAKDGGRAFNAKAAAFSFKRASAVSVNASPEPVKKGGTLTVTGTLRVADWVSGKAVGYGKKAVKLQFLKAGTKTWTTVKTVVSASNGSLKTTAKASAAGSWRFVYAGSGTVAGSTAAADYVAVK